MERNVEHHRSSSAAHSSSPGANYGAFSPRSTLEDIDLAAALSALDLKDSSEEIRPHQSLASSRNNYRGEYVDRSTQQNNGFFPSSSTTNIDNSHGWSDRGMPSIYNFERINSGSEIRNSMPSQPTTNNDADRNIPPSSSTNANYPLNPSLYHVSEERSQRSQGFVRRAMDQHTNSRLLNLLDNHGPDTAQFVLREVMADLGALSLHVLGSAFVMKLIGLVPDTELEDIIIALDTLRFKRLFSNQRGNLVMQSLVRRLQGHEDLQVLLMAGLRPIVVVLTKSPSFIDCCLDYFSPASKEMLLDEMVNRLPLMIACAWGCTTLTKCFPRHATSRTYSRLALEVARDALNLAQHCTGNYVLQHVVEQDDLLAPEYRVGVAERVAEQLKGYLLLLSMDTRGSNVVEKLLRSADANVQLLVLTELVQSRDDIMMLLQDQLGNFVAQTAYYVCRNTSDERLVTYYMVLKWFLEENAEILKHNKYGKIVLRNAKLIENNQYRRIAHE